MRRKNICVKFKQRNWRCTSDIHISIMGTHRIFAWHWHKEKWDSYTQKKRQKGVAVHTAFNVWHKSKQGGLQFQKKKEHCVTVTQIWNGQFNWKVEGYVCQPTHGKRVWHLLWRKKIWFTQSTKFLMVKNKYKWNSFTNKTKTSKGRPGKQAFETCRGC